MPALRLKALILYPISSTGERLPYKQGVEGAAPSSGTKFIILGDEENDDTKTD